jgi:predicted esterase
VNKPLFLNIHSVIMRPAKPILICTVFFLFFLQKSESQSIINPNDPVVEYDPLHPPTPPDFFNPLVKWVRTLNIENGAVQYRNPGWNSDVYKAYNYNGLAFRVQFPKTYNPAVNDGKKYPLIIFLHGQGENDNTYLGPPPPGGGSYNYDNQFQLLQGPPQFDHAIQNGTYDGYVLAPQLQNNISSPPTVYYAGILNDIMSIVKYMIANNKVDPFHIVVNGLSEGGVGTWEMLNSFPTYISSIIPMSSPVDFVDWNNTGTYFSSKRFTPIWVSQGGQDTHPTPAETQRIADTMAKYGGNFIQSFYPDAGHTTWYNVWAEQDFWPFINNSYSSNPWMIGGLKNFWPGQPINETIGITPGFTGYEWRHNGTTIGGATSNTLNVNAPGLYEARVLRDGVWSDWSHVPVNIRPGFYEAENWVSMSGVINELTQDVGGGKDVAYIDNGDWMDYTINPYTAGTFTLQLRVAATGSGGKIEIRNSDSVVLATVNVPATGGYQTWTTVSTTVTLSAGMQNIRLKSVSDIPWNINWLQFGLIGQGPLPVKFVYFNASCENAGGVALRWRTAMELNTNKFSVERSTDGAHWIEVGSVAAAGQSSQERSYVFYDKTGTGNNNMYRIIEYDFDGRQTFSSIVRSNCSSKAASIILYPNPSSGSSTLSITLHQKTNVTIKIIDSRGAEIMQKQVLLPPGINSVPLDMTSYAKGMYTINVLYNAETISLKMIKK